MIQPAALIWSRRRAGAPVGLLVVAAVITMLTLEAPRQIVFIGLIEGLSIGLLALGIILIYRTSRVINFAVGSIGALAATTLALTVMNYGWNYWFALGAALITGTAFAALIELTVITRLFTAPRVILLVATIGIAQLADLGVCLSIDDFGTGYSSFARLVDLPVSEIKIDRRFVDAAPTRQRERAVVDSIVDLAKRLNLHVVAEGIESEQQADVLTEAGCFVGQGFLFSHAVPPEEFLRKLRVVNARAAELT